MTKSQVKVVNCKLQVGYKLDWENFIKYGNIISWFINLMYGV